jgi:uncharacterized protein YacL
MQGNSQTKSEENKAIVPANPANVQIIEHGRDIHMFKITETEINELCSAYLSIDFGLFTLCTGMFVAFLITLLTTQMSDKVFATFVALISVSLLGMIFFGFRTIRQRKLIKMRAKGIMESRRI